VSPSDFGLDDMPRDGDLLRLPIIEYTTKLEEVDRFIDVAEAQAISGLDDGRLAEVVELVKHVNAMISQHAEQLGLLHADGKAEVGITDDGRLILVDAAGTADENRFLLRGDHVSKEVLRQYYAPSGLGERVLQLAGQGVPRSSWPRPPRLPSAFIRGVSQLYVALVERWAGMDLGGGIELDDAASRIAAFHAPVAGGVRR
jgi:phosphoribosylaminoimidazole-succinocarboxamide synthase